MRKTTLTYLLFLVLTAYLFIGCVEQEKVSSIKTMETAPLKSDIVLSNVKIESEVKAKEEKAPQPEYGQHTDEIEEFLSATPLGSKIYLEQKESGEWYLKIEKTFTAKKEVKETELTEPIYGDSILI